MNELASVNIGGNIESEALRLLRAVPGINVVARDLDSKSRRADAVVRFAGGQEDVVLVTRRHANAASVWQLVHLSSELPETPLLVLAGDSTVEARLVLEQNGIGLIDGLGYAHIELPGLLVHLNGGGKPTRSAPRARLKDKAGIVAQALLLNPEREWRIKDLSEQAKVSPGLVHRVVARLDREGITVPVGSGPHRIRRVANPAALLDLWAEEDLTRPTRTMAHLLVRTPDELIKRVARNLGASDIEYALTGAGAASMLAPFVTAVPVIEIWIAAYVMLDGICDAAGAERVDSGQNIVFLQAKQDSALAFRESFNGIWMTNRFRLYADLRDDPRRGKEQASHLRREVIGF